MSDKTLFVLMGGIQAATITQDSVGRLSLTYDDAWRENPSVPPLSLSMPTSRKTHENPVVLAFLWGLLPDSEEVLEKWARTYHVSAGNPFALLQHVGEDCAGAAQFVAPERRELIMRGEGGIEWLTNDDIAAKLRLLRRDPTSWHTSLMGQFSLAGAQAKTALYWSGEANAWGVPWGAAPTTHILKPGVSGFDDHDLNEHICLEAARRIGLPAVHSKIGTFDNERAIVVERYDRVRIDGSVLRIHQEDTCQALGVMPMTKYQNEGGPSPESIIQLLRSVAEPADATALVWQFVDALIFNWVVGGTDAHAKNYSVLLSGAQVRCAPMYDVASAFPYDDMYVPKLRMAMRIGREYRLEAVAARHWHRFAEFNHLDGDLVIARAKELVRRVPDAFSETANTEEVRSVGTNLPSRLVDEIAARADRCHRALTPVA